MHYIPYVAPLLHTFTNCHKKQTTNDAHTSYGMDTKPLTNSAPPLAMYERNSEYGAQVH